MASQATSLGSARAAARLSYLGISAILRRRYVCPAATSRSLARHPIDVSPLSSRGSRPFGSSKGTNSHVSGPALQDTACTSISRAGLGGQIVKRPNTARQTSIASPGCRHITSSAVLHNEGSFHRSDFSGQGYTGVYETGPTQGPLKDASNIGVPRITPRTLKDHLDQFVVGQERAKKVLSVAVYNHYQRIQELERQEEELEEMLAQQARRERARDAIHPLEGMGRLRKGITYIPDADIQEEFPGQQRTVNAWDPNNVRPAPPPPPHALGAAPIIDASPLTIEKSNVLLLGPSGVGKTLMAKTLARVLEVPFSMSDCTPFTQAGYIGEDADICVQRLLAAANFDVAKAERGIIVLDEIDKIATAKVSHGKDVSGEGVQQALLKIIEGTTLQIQAKADRNTGGPGRNKRSTSSSDSSSGLGSSTPPSGPGKSETYDVRTDNILFICTGAFIGLHKLILNRISKSSIGFNADVRASTTSSSTDPNNTLLPASESHLFHKHLPFYSPVPPSPSPTTEQPTYNTLDLLLPTDLRTYGLIPELIGRIPITCALSPLSPSLLVKVLTEPRNSLLKQYEQLFALSSLDLRFTTPALHALAHQAAEIGTGARALRTVMERVLADAMYTYPGDRGVRYILVTEDVVHRKRGVWIFPRDGRGEMLDLLGQEEERWQDQRERDGGGGGGGDGDGEGEGQGWLEERARANREGGAARTFEEYRNKAVAAGFG